MKKSLLILSLFFGCCPADAQPSLSGDNHAPVRLRDIETAYEQTERPLLDRLRPEDAGTGKELAEEGTYLYDRWLWYWRQHTDEQGYLVSGAKTLQEWNAYGQKHSLSSAKNTGNTSNWSFAGPTQSPGGYAGIGRVNALAFHPTDINTYWIGAAGGGVWKTSNNGLSWTCLTDNLPALSATDLDVNPQNPNTLYLCTGDGEGRDYFSIGVLKSTDGGASWDTTGLNWGASSLRWANSLVINRLDTSSLLLAASDGIYKSNNAGASWTRVRTGYFKQLLYSPVDTAVVFATNYYTAANGVPAQIFRSADGGATWLQVTNLSNSWRITLAVTPADPKVVKAIAATYSPSIYRGLLGIYGSTDTGKTFGLLFAPGAGCANNLLSGNPSGSGCTGQGNYDLAMAISPVDASKVYIGGVNSWYSSNGGASWQILNQWSGSLPGVVTVHADKHFLGFHPLMASRLFECNDGGIYRTDNPTSQVWNFIGTGLGITQFYRNAINYFNNDVLGGAQDNGTKGLMSGTWDDITGGDGMECQTSALSPDFYCTGVQYGVIYATQDGGQNFDRISDNVPGQPDGAWITPYVEHPTLPGTLLAGYQQVFQSNDFGQNWAPVSPLFPNLLLRLGLTRADANTIYAVEEDSNQVHYTFNMGNSWNTLTAPFGTNISDIRVDPKDKNHFWITLTGYGTDKVAEYKPATGWLSRNGNLPNVPVNCIEYDTATRDLYIGTEVGVFRWDTAAVQWELFNTHLPTVRVNDLAINYNTGEIWAATYGRGMWKSPKPVPSGISQVPHSLQSLQVAPVPGHGIFTLSGFGEDLAGKPVSLSLTDYGGRLAWRGEGVPDQSGTMRVRITGVAAGSYMIQVALNERAIGKAKVVLY